MLIELKKSINNGQHVEPKKTLIMKPTLFILLSAFSLNIHAQQTLSVDQVNNQWQTRNLKVENAQPNILQFVQTFQKAFPTYSGAELIKFSKSSANYTNNDKVVDIKNGYVLYSEDDPDSENDEQLQACVWRRSNGHSLLAVNLHRFSSEIDVLCLYDYNPQTKTLTPEKSLNKLFTPSYPGYRYRVWLPRHGKNLEVEEFFGALSIKHTYSWDGMKPYQPKTTINRFNFYQSVFKEHTFFADEHPLTHYALVDLDEDNFPELLLKSDDEEDETYLGAFAVKLAIEILGAQDDRRTLSFYKGAVCSSGHCGAGCSSATYYTLENSSQHLCLVEETNYNMQSDEEETTYTLEGDEISEQQGNNFIKALGEEITLQPKWKRLTTE